jgi:ribonuclease P protein component
MVLYVVPRERGLRAAFVCGRRVGGAVARNRARRVMREACRELAPAIQGGSDIVFVARPGIVGAKMQDVATDMEAELRSAGVLR